MKAIFKKKRFITMLKGFRDLVVRDNIVDLAVGVVVTAAFGTVVAAFVKELIPSVIAACSNKPGFYGLIFPGQPISRFQASGGAFHKKRVPRAKALLLWTLDGVRFALRR